MQAAIFFVESVFELFAAPRYFHAAVVVFLDMKYIFLNWSYFCNFCTRSYVRLQTSDVRHDMIELCSPFVDNDSYFLFGSSGVMCVSYSDIRVRIYLNVVWRLRCPFLFFFVIIPFYVGSISALESQVCAVL